MDAMEERLRKTAEHLASELGKEMVFKMDPLTREKGFPNGVLCAQAFNNMGMVLIMRCEVDEDALAGRTRPVVKWHMGWRADDGGVAPLQVEGSFKL